MKKVAYETPVVEITKWQNSDVITTSGLTADARVLGSASIGQEGCATASLDYSDFAE